MSITSLLKSCSLLVASLLLASCANGPDAGFGRQRPYVPAVAMPDPSTLSENERRYLPEVADVLEQAGYRPTAGNAEYRVDVHLEDGPVNADTRLVLLRGHSEIARANARAGGVTMLLRRSQFVSESFHKCLEDFATQIPRPAGESGSNPGNPSWNSGW